MDIDLEVKERQTGFLSIGGGYSSVDKFVGMVDITQGNLGGKGRTVKLRAEVGSKATTYELSFREPWLLDRPVSFTASVYKTSREYINYDRKSYGLSLGLGKRFRDFWSANISYNYEEATILDIRAGATTIIQEQEGTKVTSSVSPSIARDSRDNFLDPHTGSTNGLYLTYAGLGGDNRFLKAVAESAWFYPVTKRTTFSVRGVFGWAEGVGGRPLPIYERFYVGGIYSIRGLDQGEAGPRDEFGNIIGGKRKLVFNAEYLFPLLEELKLKGVVFYDAGTAYDHRSDIKFRQTAGAGFRWMSPIGPLRLEWGYNLDRQRDERQSKWEFTFGTFF